MALFFFEPEFNWDECEAGLCRLAPVGVRQPQHVVILDGKGDLVIREAALQVFDGAKGIAGRRYAELLADRVKNELNFGPGRLCPLFRAPQKRLEGLFVPADDLLQGVGVARGEDQL